MMVTRKTATILVEPQSLEEIVQTDGNLKIKELEAECLDCFDTMIKVYDSEDDVRYQCENCDFTQQVGVQAFDD
jgi:Zn finger protein HypA/HybF involved in hydrogenase expression